MDLSALSDVLAFVGTLAKEIGKGGGGSTEEPSVCMSLVPVALGVGFVGVQRLRQVLRRRARAPRLSTSAASARAPGGA
jgi:hypothetical protein